MLPAQYSCVFVQHDSAQRCFIGCGVTDGTIVESDIVIRPQQNHLGKLTGMQNPGGMGGGPTRINIASMGQYNSSQVLISGGLKPGVLSFDGELCDEGA